MKQPTIFLWGAAYASSLWALVRWHTAGPEVAPILAIPALLILATTVYAVIWMANYAIVHWEE